MSWASIILLCFRVDRVAPYDHSSLSHRLHTLRTSLQWSGEREADLPGNSSGSIREKRKYHCVCGTIPCSLLRCVLLFVVVIFEGNEDVAVDHTTTFLLANPANIIFVVQCVDPFPRFSVMCTDSDNACCSDF